MLAKPYSQRLSLWISILLVLCLPLLSFWVTPAGFSHNQVVLCTLQGTETVWVDKNGQLHSVPPLQHCPALQLFNTLTLGLSVALALMVLAKQIIRFAPLILYVYQVPHRSVYVSQAPPA